MDKTFQKRVLKAQSTGYHEFVREEAVKEGFSLEQIDYTLDLVESVSFPVIKDVFNSSDLPQSLEQKLLQVAEKVVILELESKQEEDLRASLAKDLGYMILLTPESSWRRGSYQIVLEKARASFSRYLARYGEDDLNLASYSIPALGFMIENGVKVRDLLRKAYDRFKSEFKLTPDKLLPTAGEIVSCIPITEEGAEALLIRYSKPKRR